MLEKRGKTGKLFPKNTTKNLKKVKNQPHIPHIDSFGEDNDVAISASYSKWFEENILQSKGNRSLSDQELGNIRQEAGKLFQLEATAAGKTHKSISKTDFNWIKTVISKGTVSDKMAAYVLLLQDDPVVNFHYLKNMIGMVKVSKKRECFMVVDTLVELFTDHLLPPDRKLQLLVQQSVSAIDKLTPDKRNRLLVLWFFEEKLKASYSSFITALNEAAHDTVDANKEKALLAMYKLLKGHPEQEAILLANIVNKMGDPSHKVGSKVVYILNKLLDAHPAMKQVVMEEVEKLIFRPNMGKRAQYYAVCFLTQFTYTSEDSELASRMVSIYFSLFKACTKTGDIDSKMMSALLNGVSRAFPFMKGECSVVNEHINTVYKVVHLSRANVAIHALSLLYLVVGETLTDRFMSVLYKKIGETSMFLASHHAIFLSVIFKSLNKDENNERLSAFIKRLLQVTSNLPVPLVCGILMLLSQINENKKTFCLALEQEASTVAVAALDDDDDDEDEHYDDVIIAPKAHQETKDEKLIVIKEEKTEAASSWFHANLKKVDAGDCLTYDPFQRLPQHAHASGVILAEAFLLTRHFHPSVALFAANIIQGKRIVYNGDPLQDFSLIRFLDKFVFKNPKKVNREQEQVSTFARFGRTKYYSSVGLKGLRVNTDDYLNNDENIIPVDEHFMYSYLKTKKLGKPQVKTEEEDEDSEAESVNDDEFDVILNRVTGGKKLQGDDDLNFMDEIGTIPTEKKDESAEMDEGSELEEEEDSNADDDDEEDDSGASGAEDFDGDEQDDLSDDDDLLSDDEMEENIPKSKLKGKRGGPRDKSSLFASAEEFAELLERDDYMAGTSAALSNKDNAGVKQLMWEDKRDQWVKGSKFRRSSNSGKKEFKGIKRKHVFNKNASGLKKKRKV